MAQGDETMTCCAGERTVSMPITIEPNENGKPSGGRYAPGVLLTSEEAERHSKMLRWLLLRLRKEALTPEMRLLHVTAIEGLLELLDPPQRRDLRVAAEDDFDDE
jgi:hypothetical protein